MPPIISAVLALMAGFLRSRASLCLEHLALRHQLALYKQTVRRPRVRCDQSSALGLAVLALAGLA
jgi:hypothetical protein